MESGRNLFINHRHHSSSNNDGSNDARGMWNSWSTTPRIDWNTPLSHSVHHVANVAAAAPSGLGEGVVHALMMKTHLPPFSPCLYSCGGNGNGNGNGGGGGGGCGCGSQYQDPHLMCLKLGKRHYFGDAAASANSGPGDRQQQGAVDYASACNGKRGKPFYVQVVGGAPTTSPSSSGVTVVGAAAAAIPRCQVDGCQVALVNAKDYHRRHKVCEMHSKAPKVFVLGLEQRFCQQCSRFHAVGEFDESKRSCRRRLAGHNERRRKSSQDQSTPRNHHPHQVNRKLMNDGGRHPQLPLSNGCALSLLSSKNDASSSGDLPARCSAALRELIAENRASILARQLILDKDLQWQHHHQQQPPDAGQTGGSDSLVHYHQQQQQQQMGSTGSHGWDRIAGSGGDGHVTLDLMQAPTSAFGFL